MFGISLRSAASKLLPPAAAAAGVFVSVATPACGQVMQIGKGGDVVVYDAPAVFGPSGATPIVSKRAVKRRPRHVPAATVAPAGAISAAAVASELSPALVRAVAEQESGLRPRVVSRAGAIGEMQLMPTTARALGVDAADSDQNYRGGAAYLRLLLQRYDGDVVRALAAYNAGPGAVDRFGGPPPFKETQAYVAAVLERLSRAAERDPAQ